MLQLQQHSFACVVAFTASARACVAPVLAICTLGMCLLRLNFNSPVQHTSDCQFDNLVTHALARQ